MALSANRDTDAVDLKKVYGQIKDDEVIYQGALVAFDSSGEVVAATATTGLKNFGRAEAYVDNTDDGKFVDVSIGGCFKWANGSSLTIADIGSTVYADDDQTVHGTATGRSAVGILVDVESDGVWVQHLVQQASGLTAANNLSDVSNAATSRGNLGIITHLVFDGVSTKASDGQQVRYVHSGPDATIEHIRTVLGAALATDDATLTADIEGSAVTDGVVTMTQSGSAEDDVDVATPSAANVISEGEVLTMTIGGGSTATATCGITVELSY